MTNTITINNQNLALRQYRGQMVVTFKDIDRVHGRPAGTASRNFRSNRQRFIEGEDYFKICPDEIRRHKIMSISPKVREDIVFITESGYYMLTKSFNDALSWEVQRQLVKTYFRYKKQLPEPHPDKLHEYFDKTYNGVPVLTTSDVEYLTKINRATVDWNLRTKLVNGKDYYYITGAELKSFKKENPRVSKLSSAMYLVTREGFIKLCRAYGIKMEEPKCFEDKSKKQNPKIQTLNLQQVDELFEKEAICVSNDNVIPIFRAIELFGTEAVAHSKSICDAEIEYSSSRLKCNVEFNTYYLGKEDYKLCYMTKKAFRLAATYRNVDNIRNAGF